MLLKPVLQENKKLCHRVFLCILKRNSVFFSTLCQSRCLGSQVVPGRAGCKDCAPGGRHKNPLIIVHSILCQRKCPDWADNDKVILFTGLKGGGARVVDVYCRCGGPGRLRN